MAESIGDVIREQVSKSSLSNKQITDKLNRSGNTIYNLYSKTSIDTDTLLALCEILDFDFFEFFYRSTFIKKFRNKDVEVLIKDRDELKKELLRKSDLISDLQTSIATKTELINDLKEQVSLLKKSK